MSGEPFARIDAEAFEAAKRSPRTRGPAYVRDLHPYAFRSGEWAEIVALVESYGGLCWFVRFSDGGTDWWVCDDAAAEFEFAEAEPKALNDDQAGSL